MAEKKKPVRVEQRTLSGRGIVKVPQDKNIRMLYLYLRVVRLPRLNFTSSKFNPDKSEYAKITWLRGDYVLKEQALNYEAELQTWEQDSVAYLAYANVCMYNSLIAYFDYLCVPLQLSPLPRTYNLHVEPIQNLPDIIKVVCRDDTAIIADLWRYDYDIACNEADTVPPPPPDPPSIDKVPPGTPIGDISPPYTGDNDDGDTQPNTGDETAPPPDAPIGIPCQLITVVYEYETLSGETVLAQQTLYAPYYSIRIKRVGTVGVDYGEEIAITCARQDPLLCNNGEIQEIQSGYQATAPLARSVTFIGYEPA